MPNKNKSNTANTEKSPVPASLTKFAQESAAMVPAGVASLFTTEQMPDEKDLERLNLPPMLNPKQIPVKATVSGKLVRIVENFTGRKDMRKARLMELKHANGTAFLIPLTGVIRNALKAYLIPDEAAKKLALSGAVDAKDKAEIELMDYYKLSPEVVGKTLYLTRTFDQPAKKFGEGKTMFMFDVLISRN